jgi:hypothetical protein
METTKPSTRPSRHIDAIEDLIDEVLDNPTWSFFDRPPSGTEYDREVDLERRLAGL